jgi:hypothetical protein
MPTICINEYKTLVLYPGLPLSGRKDELVSRVLQDLEENNK